MLDGSCFFARAGAWGAILFVAVALRAEDVDYQRQVAPILRARCMKCHGPGKQEAKLDVSSPNSLRRGGESGPVVKPHDPNASLLWKKIADGEMPPDDPLSEAEQKTLRQWIAEGAKGPTVRAEDHSQPADHWSFRPLRRPSVPSVTDRSQIRTAVDAFVLAQLEKKGLGFTPEADRLTLLRRVYFDLTGLPPTPEEIARFQADSSPDAYERLVDRLLASPRYGERWGKWWLDAVGYADSNGYFNADSDRPLAYQYRDYVVRSLNADKPLDRFLLEQFAGDELAHYRPGDESNAETIDLLIATHFLRNAQDGSGESDGNPDEVLADRMSVLEGLTQMIGSGLLGLTIQCARCHDHKFEPITQRDYYSLQAVFAPAFDVNRWLKPNERVIHAASTAELQRWRDSQRRLDEEIAALQRSLSQWAREHRPVGELLFADDFQSRKLAPRWSATAPGDDAPGGVNGAVEVDSASAPGAVAQDGRLHIIESGAAGDRWLSTTAAFDWTPEHAGEWIQATFDLVDLKVAPKSPPAERVGYFIALHDFNGNSKAKGGNLLIDGNPGGGAAAYSTYPAKTSQLGQLTKTPYQAGRNYGVRVTRRDDGKFALQHVVDGLPEEKSTVLTADDLPSGGFGFEYCCGRSFIVDNVRIERSRAGGSSPREKDVLASFEKHQKETLAKIEAVRARKTEQPGKIAWVTDVAPTPPETFVLKRGLYSDRGEKVGPAGLTVLSRGEHRMTVVKPTAGSTTGRRLAFARWLTAAGSPAAGLLARVQVNRVWQRRFGTGLAATSENLGLSGTPATHPELLEFLAERFVHDGWRLKPLHREILLSSACRQSSAASAEARSEDADNRLLSRFPLLRLDAEAIRDAMLAASGELDLRIGGPYVRTTRTPEGEVLVDEKNEGSRRRSMYLQQRRTQVVSLLEVFDAPSIVCNCTRRSNSTIALQSLSLLNSPFALARADSMAKGINGGSSLTGDKSVDRAFLLTLNRLPTAVERSAARRFLRTQTQRYHSSARVESPECAKSEGLAWRDFCQMLMASNGFLYVE